MTPVSHPSPLPRFESLEPRTLFSVTPAVLPALVPVAPYTTVYPVAPGAPGDANFGPSASETSFDFINLGKRFRIRQTGDIQQFKLALASTADVTGFYLTVWRPNSAGTYDLVSTSENFATSLLANDTSTLTLSTPIAARQGDYIGAHVEYAAGATTPIFHTTPVADRNYAGLFSISNSSPSSSNFDWSAQTLTANQAVVIEADMVAPILLTVGDSVISGYPQTTSFADDFPQFDPQSDLAALLGQSLNTTYQNLGISGETTAKLLPLLAPDVLALHPQYVILGVGVNDVRNGVAQSTTLANWTTILTTLHDAGITPVMLSIYPFMGAGGILSASQLRLRDQENAWLAANVPSFGGIYVDLDPVLSTTYPAGDPGNHWQYQPSLTADGLHPNAYGQRQIDAVVFNALAPLLTASLSPTTHSTTTLLTFAPDVSDSSLDVLTATVLASDSATIPDGPLTFIIAGIPTTVTLASGVATLTVPASLLNDGPIMASYSGVSVTSGIDPDQTSDIYLASNSSFTGQSTTTSLSSSTTSAVVAGTSITLTVTVQSSSIPVGTVTFFDNGFALIATATLDALGVATLTRSNLLVGTHLITAVYNPTSTFQSSTSDVITQILIKNTSVTTLVASSPTVLESQPLTLVATVIANPSAPAPGNPLPTGKVNFFDTFTNTTIATVNLDANSRATLTTSSLLYGSHTFVALYAGSGIFAPSNSGYTTTIAIKATPVVTLTLGSSSITFGQTTALVATVTGTHTQPTGQVSLYDGATLIATGYVQSNGKTTFGSTIFSIGTHSLSLLYAGDSTYVSVPTPAPSLLTVARVPVSIALSSNLIPPANVGTTITFTAKVTANVGTPAGSVTFIYNTTLVLGTVALVNGTATLTTSSLGGGTSSITCLYNGSSTYTPSTSPTLLQPLNKFVTTTTLSASTTASVLSAPVTFIATVSSATTALPLDGHVNFYDSSNNSTLASINVDPTGRATFTTTSLSVGNHTLIALYSGSATFATSSSSAGSIAPVDIKAVPTVTLALGLYSITRGQTFSILSTVTGSLTPPTGGQVSLYDGTNLIATGYVQSNGTTAFGCPKFTIGTHSLTILYAGNATYASTTSAPAILTVS